MAHIKKLVMHGFKSFVRKTEIPLTPEINVIMGPNGSGKSNITDALCFVLGRLSIKSMRAAKAKNLIFMGSKAAGPAKEASVEIVFDNSDKAFTVDKKEISLKRIVRKNGQSIYKINNQTKTRQEVLALLAQAGIDPYGYNIILQGEIQNLVRMHTEERRKIIEEVSGISIYESRKEKSLKELDKTEEKLKEIEAILRERTAYLNNLEKERQQALKFQKLEQDVKIFKASILASDLKENKKNSLKIDEEISKQIKEIDKLKKTILQIQQAIKDFEAKVETINSTIQKSTGLEQEKLNQEIANIRAKLAGMEVKLENFESKLPSMENQKKELQNSILENEKSIEELQKSLDISEKNKKKKKEVELKKKELEILEEKRKKFYTIKTELKSIKEMLEDKKNILQNYNVEAEFLIKQSKSVFQNVVYKDNNEKKLSELKVSLAEKKDILQELRKKEILLEKKTSTDEYEIEDQKKIVDEISKMDVCPVCKNKITEEHVYSIKDETLPRIERLQKDIESSDKEITNIYTKRDLLEKDVEQIESEISQRELDLVKISNLEEKKNQIKALQENIEKAKVEVSELEKRKSSLEKSFDDNSNVEQRYETVRVEVEEISQRSDENLDSEISFKKREFERARISLKQLVRDEADLKENVNELKKNLSQEKEILAKKKKQEEDLSKKFEKLISERDGFQNQSRQKGFELIETQNKVRNFEQKINNLKIDKAKFDATIENLEVELLAFPNVKIISTQKQVLVQRLAKTQEILSRIGSVNMRSLEVYEDVKKEYDSIKGKMDIISKEKESILKIIHEIDVKKKKSFLKTFESLNEIFAHNFSQLSTKGQVSLELENRKDPFAGGVNVVVKMGHGKYFDVTSLSGGEQTLVALSLIFAIQDLNPYCFYVLDEIDAALDKRNSERLANLLRKYMQKGQYIVVSHNDEVITNANSLFGVSMHDGISKIISLKL